jgi:hypothetical protein
MDDFFKFYQEWEELLRVYFKGEDSIEEKEKSLFLKEDTNAFHELMIETKTMLYELSLRNHVKEHMEELKTSRDFDKLYTFCVEVEGLKKVLESFSKGDKEKSFKRLTKANMNVLRGKIIKSKKELEKKLQK